MIAYNPIWLNNLVIKEYAHTAYQKNLIIGEEKSRIDNSYPDKFYSPNFFIRVGMFLLTVVIVFFSFGLFTMLFLNSVEQAIGGLSIFFGLVAYGCLEYIIKRNNHLQSGVDDALLWIAAGLVYGGLAYATNAGPITNSLLLFLVSLFGCLRFGDRIMSLVCFISMAAIFFFTFNRLGPIAKASIPFVIMGLSALIYFLVKRIMQQKINLLYENCLQLVSIAALLLFYLSGNYYVVRELSIALFDTGTATNQSPAFGGFWWAFTMLVPLIYFLRGIQKKDIILLRTGLILVALTVITLRYYIDFASVEILVAVSGAVLILLAIGLSKYVSWPVYGFTNIEDNSPDTAGRLSVESIVQAETFSRNPEAPVGSRFGGGSFGGGGASGEF